MGSEDFTNEYLAKRNEIICFGIQGIARTLEKMPDDISRLFRYSTNTVYKNRWHYLGLINPLVVIDFLQDLEPFSQNPESNLVIPEVNKFFYSRILMFKKSTNPQIDCYSIIGNLKKRIDFLEDKITPEFKHMMYHYCFRAEQIMLAPQKLDKIWVKLGKN